MRYVAAGLIVMLVGGATLAGQAEKWKRFTPEGERFTALFPGEPKEKEITLQGGTKQKQYLLDLGDTAYLVATQPTPSDSEKASKKAFDAARDAVVRQLKGRLLRDEELRLAGHPGREIEMELPGDAIYTQRMYLVDDQLIQLIAVRPKTQDSQNADTFFSAFRLTKQK